MKLTLLSLFALIWLPMLSGCANAQTGVRNIDAATFQRQTDEESQEIILDVRTAGELSEGMIAGAKHMDVLQADFRQKAATLDLSKPIYVYCKVGGRSSQAAQILRQMGATQVYNLEGGMTAWKAKQLPVTRP